MSKETALQRYTSAVGAIEEHIKENKAVFDSHQKLVMAQLDAENALRDAVAEEGAGCSNGIFDVTLTPMTQTVYNEDKIFSLLSLTRESAVGAGLITINQRPPRITIGKVRSS